MRHSRAGAWTGARLTVGEGAGPKLVPCRVNCTPVGYTPSAIWVMAPLHRKMTPGVTALHLLSKPCVTAWASQAWLVSNRHRQGLQKQGDSQCRELDSIVVCDADVQRRVPKAAGLPDISVCVGHAFPCCPLRQGIKGPAFLKTLPAELRVFSTEGSPYLSLELHTGNGALPCHSEKRKADVVA